MDERYIQTWKYIPHWTPVRKAIQFICWLVTRHEPSKTEWGYGGGDSVDGWCRWCDKQLHMPISEARFRFPSLNNMAPHKWDDFKSKSGYLTTEGKGVKWDKGHHPQGKSPNQGGQKENDANDRS